MRGRRMEEVRSKEMEGRGLLKENGDGWGREVCEAGLGGCRLAGLRDNLDGAAGSAWGAYGSGLKGWGPVWEGVALPGGLPAVCRTLWGAASLARGSMQLLKGLCASPGGALAKFGGGAGICLGGVSLRGCGFVWGLWGWPGDLQV